MFRECVNAPIDPIPVEYVNTLKRLVHEPDYSLTCLGVALLKSRIEDYAGIDGIYIEHTDEESCMQDFLQREANDYPVFCYYKYSTPAKSATELNKLKEAGYEVKESIGALLKDKADTRCIAVYHKTKNIAAIFINSRDMRFYHMLISFISLLFPSLFEKKPLEEQDYNVIKALSKTSKDMFIQKIQEAVQPYVMEFRRLMLTNLLRLMHDKKIESAKANVDNQRGRVRNAEDVFTNEIKRLKELIVIFEGMKATEQYDQPEEDLVDYLSHNKQIHNMTIEGSLLKFSVATLLNNYNPDAWETFKQRGYIYEGKYNYDGRFDVSLLEPFKTRENRKILLDNIFSESPEFTVKMAGNYILDLDSSATSTRRNYNYNDADPVFKGCMPNPHLKFYECLGGYKTRIGAALRDRNYIAAIELCIASAGSVDLDETEQTFRPFLGYLMSSKEKVLRRKDGVDMTPEEALLYLIDKENKE